MDAQSLELDRYLITTHISNARRSLPLKRRGRGSSLFELNQHLISSAESRISQVAQELSSESDSAARSAAGQRLRAVSREVKSYLSFLRPLIETVQADDTPIGLHIALDAAIDMLLPHGADPVVHLDNQHRYSTLDIYKTLGLEPRAYPTPVVFFVPVLDPFNALLMPILVHEIGHRAIDQADLSSVTMRAATDDVYPLLVRYFSGPVRETSFNVQTVLIDWVGELLCDRLATAICGPAYLFAAASFLPATARDQLSISHPFVGARLDLLLKTMEAGRWMQVINEICPETIAWLRKRSVAEVRQTREERVLGDVCRSLQPVIDSVVRVHVSDTLDADDYMNIAPQALDKLRLGVPPSQVDGRPLQPWQIVLLGWQRQFEIYGDSPVTLARGAHDRDFSRLMLRAIEMAEIARLWSESE